MGIWFRELDLLPDERLEWQVACNWAQRGRPGAGRLGLTSQALVFKPARLAARTGQSRRVPLGDIEAADVEPRTWLRVFSGGGRRRLRLCLRDGTVELLLINNLSARLTDVQTALAEG